MLTGPSLINCKTNVVNVSMSTIIRNGIQPIVKNISRMSQRIRRKEGISIINEWSGNTCL